MAEQVWKVKESGLSGGAKFAILCLMLMCFGAGFYLGHSRPAEPEVQAASNKPVVEVALKAPEAPAPQVAPTPVPISPPAPVSTVSVKIPSPTPVALEVLAVKKPEPEVIKAAKTGKIGDGKVFVSTIEDAIRIRTEEKGDSAV